jgi:hypothetical protein
MLLFIPREICSFRGQKRRQRRGVEIPDFFSDYRLAPLDILIGGKK